MLLVGFVAKEYGVSFLNCITETCIEKFTACLGKILIYDQIIVCPISLNLWQKFEYCFV